MSRRRKPAIDEGRVYVDGPIADEAYDLYKSIATWSDCLRHGKGEMVLTREAREEARRLFFEGVRIDKPTPLTLILTSGEHIEFHPLGGQRVTE